MKILRTLATLALVFGAFQSVRAEPVGARPSSLLMSPELLDLLRAEMRELESAAQAISLALPAGDWAQIAATGEKMHDSYILAKKLTEAQRMELSSLPEPFRNLDEQFHSGAKKLAQAGHQKDAELTAFYFSRLLEGCAGCHAAYARQRFPGFEEDSADAHHQH